MEHNNKLSESMSRSEPVHPYQQKENHTPHEAKKSLNNIQIGADQNGEIAWFINIDDRDVYVPCTRVPHLFVPATTTYNQN